MPHARLWLVLVGILFLLGFRVALNVADSGVIDVGYAGVIGADRIADGHGLYGEFPEDNAHGDTYGPLTYLVYVPFEQAMPWSGAWDDLPAAHGAALFFDLLTALGLFVLGRRLRAGPSGTLLGAALTYAWLAYPYSQFALQSNSNDSLVAAARGLGARSRSRRPAARGALTAAGFAAKFASLALAPLLAAGSGDRRPRSLAAFVIGALVVGAALVVPFLPDGGPHELWDRTLGYQADRDSPFSIWGQVGGLDGGADRSRRGRGAARPGGVLRSALAHAGTTCRPRGRRHHRQPAGGRPLVLPLHRLVRPARSGRAVRGVADHTRARANSGVSRRWWTAAGALLLLSWAAVLWLDPFADERFTDLLVYASYAKDFLGGALPYRDFGFEYPPLAVLVMGLGGVFGTDYETYRAVFAGLMLLAAALLMVGCAALAARTGGDVRRAALAAALAPLLTGAMIRTHFDLVPVLLVVAALLAIVRDRVSLGFALIGIGAVTKAFPLVLAPVALAWLLAQNRRRDAARGAIALALTVAAVLGAAYALSPGGVELAFEYQTDRPVQVESAPAVVLRATRRRRRRTAAIRPQPQLGRPPAPRRRRERSRSWRSPARSRFCWRPPSPPGPLGAHAPTLVGAPLYSAASSRSARPWPSPRCSHRSS